MTQKTVLVTGAGRGIGRAIALECFRQGCRVILVGRTAATLEDTCQLAIDAGCEEPQVHIRCLDLSDAKTLLDQVPLWPEIQEGLFGLVNNAVSQTLQPLADYSLEAMERTWQVNMRAPLLMMQACYPFLKKARGSVVNIGSVSDTGYAAEYALYGGSKAFLNHASRHLAKELGYDGVRINLVTPGGVETPLMKEAETHHTPEEILDTKKSIPIEQRWAHPKEIAEAVWFALDGPQYLHGADLRVHGGMSH